MMRFLCLISVVSALRPPESLTSMTLAAKRTLANLPAVRTAVVDAAHRALDGCGVSVPVNGASASPEAVKAQVGAVAKYFGDESTPPPPVATVAPDTPAETVDDLLNWAEGLEARERAMSPPPRLSSRRRRGDEWL